ncbi:MAG TPA: ATP-binding protein [Acidobacteriota bacterium]|nr:ATP-binding protein [Acidobacteriota bacterium]
MDDFKHKLNLVIVIRTILITIILTTIYVTAFFYPQHRLATAFYGVMLSAFVINILLVFFNKLPERLRPAAVYVHLLFDFTLVNFIVFITGVVETPFSLLYLFIILYSSLFLRFAGVSVITVLSCLSFLGIKFIYFFVFNPVVELWETVKAFILATEVNLMGFALVGFLIGLLAERLRLTRLKVEQQTGRLQDLKEYNESILASLRSGLLTTDRSFLVVKINQMGLTLLGRAIEDVFGQNALTMFDLSPDVQAEIHNAGEDLRPVRSEKWLPVGPSPMYVGLSISPLMVSGSVEGYVFIFQDLTDIKRLENELEVQRKMAAIGNLSAAIAHEIRNPLASMMGSIQVLKNQLTLSSSQGHLMDIVLRESHRLDRIIADFLQYASPRRFSPKVFEITALLQETIFLFKNSPEVRDGHRIEYIGCPSGLDFHGDPDQIKQVFWNLCTNAIKAMPAGGTLRIDCRPQEGGLIIEFRDTGRGMGPAELQQLFEPFQSRFPSGMGLGMAIVYRIVSDHRGRIEVESAPGQGTSVRIMFKTETINLRREAVPE